jgi:hypothetical protein
MKKLALTLSMLAVMCGCAGPSSHPSIGVTVTPAVPPDIDQGQSAQFTAILTGDTTHAGVIWSVSGPGCSGKACGTLSNVTSTSATYNAPASVSAELNVTVTATSAASSSQYSTATLNVWPPPNIITTTLPTATPGNPYSASLQAVGGVLPLKWSLASGSLPAGLSINGAGTIFGSPTTGGTSTFTLKVTDSSTAPNGALSTLAKLTLSVVGTLTITTLSLPAGTVGVAYSSTLSLSGGLPPYNWSIYSGNLPTGLMLQTSSGVISGTPTTPGPSSFTLEVVDSSPIQQSLISSTYSITINASGPLTIRTRSLLDATVGLPYQAQVVATGGAPPLTWSITAGALPPGLSLSATTGAISGIPTGTSGASYSFTVESSDSSTPPETSTQQLSIVLEAAPATCSNSGNNSVLAGQYAFSLRGFNGTGFLTVVGSFNADGNGDITAGEADTNGVLGPATGNLITGASYYSVGPDNRGCATIATPFGTFFTRFAVGDLSNGAATQGRIIEFDNPGPNAYVASGEILQQNSDAFVTTLTGSFSLKTAGWDFSTSGRVACVGIVTGAKLRFSFLEQDCNDDGTVSNTTNTGLTTTYVSVNTYGAADANGRATGILAVGQTTTTFSFYWVSLAQLLVVNSDPTLAYSGDWQQVQVPLGGTGFNQNSLNSNLAAYATGIGPSGASGDVSIAAESANGSNSLTAQLYRDVAGAWQTSTPTCTYSVVVIGRVTQSGGACEANPPILYLNTLNTAFMVGTDSSIELGSVEPQTTGLSTASLAGTYVVGTSEVVSQAAQTEVGIFTVTGTGTYTSTTDTASTVSQNVDVAGSDTLSLNSNGTFSTGSSGGTTVGIAISGTNFVLVNNPTLTFPTLLIGQQ